MICNYCVKAIEILCLVSYKLPHHLSIKGDTYGKLFDISTFSIVSGKIHHNFAMTCHQLASTSLGMDGGQKSSLKTKSSSNPCIWVSNHVHYFDWWPFRCYMEERVIQPHPLSTTTISISCCSLVFEYRRKYTVVSRGYLIAGDFTSQLRQTII